MNIQTLRNLGIEVSLSHSGKIHLEAEPGVVTPEVRSRIAVNKQSLLDELQGLAGSVNLVNLVNLKSDCVAWDDDNPSAQTTDVSLALQDSRSGNEKSSPHLFGDKLKSNSPSGEEGKGPLTLTVDILFRHGIHASLTPSGKLRLECARGVMTPALKMQIEENRHGLTAELQIPVTAEPVNLLHQIEDAHSSLVYRGPAYTSNQCSPSSPSSQNAGQSTPFIFRSWHKVADSYYVHHFACKICQAAGRGAAYGVRCNVGQELWSAYMLAL